MLAAAAVLVAVSSPSTAFAQVVPGADVHARTSDKAWIDVSNGYTKQLLGIGLKHGPEGGSAQGLAQYDTLISNPTLADERVQRKETEAALARIKAASATEKDRNVLEDIAIVEHSFRLGFRAQDYAEAH